MSDLLAAALVAAAGVYLTACIVVFGRKTPGYRHVRQTISELGETGAPYQRAIAFRVFLPVGVLLLGAAGLLFPASQPAAALGLCIAVGYLVAAFFPCDPGSPASGTPRQAIHNLGGGIEYIGGGAALLVLARTHGDVFRWCGFAVFAAAALITLLPPTSARGLVQRVAETILFAALAAIAAGTLHGAWRG